MTQWQAAIGQMLLEITCADCVTLLNTFCEQGINLNDVQYCGDLTLHVKIVKQDYYKAHEIIQKAGASVKILKKSGVYWECKSVIKRPILLSFLCVLLVFVCWLPSRVLFITIEGNLSIPDNRILEAAGECGIVFGASRRVIRSEKMKNALLQKIPQLQWAGINTSGCTAVISVKEKTEPEIQQNPKNKVCSIVAIRDGIVQNCTVYQGNPLCSVGQAVKAGQTLVSGYLDCGTVIKATCANAEIRALTFRELEVVTPAATAIRGALSEQKNKYCLRIGKKLIKLSKDSGNLDTACVKIYTEKYVCLPGGFCLPISVIKETQLFYNDRTDIQTDTDHASWLTDSAQVYLQSTMVAGEIISADTELDYAGDFACLRGKYACMEMIGQIKYEQTMQRNEEND